MHIRAELEGTTVTGLLADLLPATIVLDEDEGEHRCNGNELGGATSFPRLDRF